jgi:hypothetical protein
VVVDVPHLERVATAEAVLEEAGVEATQVRAEHKIQAVLEARLQAATPTKTETQEELFRVAQASPQDPVVAEAVVDLLRAAERAGLGAEEFLETAPAGTLAAVVAHLDFRSRGTVHLKNWKILKEQVPNSKCSLSIEGKTLPNQPSFV